MHQAIENKERLQQLAATGVLDRVGGEAFERLANLARRSARAPIGMITFLDSEQVFIRAAATPEPLEKNFYPLKTSFCRHVVESGAEVKISDSATDERVRRSPVKDELGIKAYLGVPLKVDGIHTLGSLCVIDHEPREWGDEETNFLNELAQSVLTEIRLSIAIREQNKVNLEKNALIVEIDRERAIFEALFEQMPAGACLLDPSDGKMILANKAIRDFIAVDGLTDLDLSASGRFLGYRAGKKIAAEDWPVARTLNSGETIINEEIEFLRPDNKWATLLVNSSMVKNSQGTPLGILATCNDITDRKDADRDREAALKQLKRSSKRKDRFLSVLAHELRNPLAVIANGLDLWEQKSPKKDQGLCEIRGAMHVQVEYLVRLIEDLLDTARIRSGKIRLEKSSMNVVESLSQAVDSTEHLLKQKGHSLKKQFSGEVWVKGDSQRLVQVLTNLLSNAAKYTPDNGDINVEVMLVDGYVEIAVRDNGQGVPQNAQREIFDFYAQLDEGRKDLNSGLGIGLHLAREIVQLHHGELKLESKGEGRGATFTVRLPVCPAPESRGLGLGLSPAPDSPRLKILVLDDSVHIGKFLKMMLQSLNHEAKVFTEGAAALQELESWVPDLIISDLAMPGMSGYDFARSVKLNPAWSEIPLVALSGFSQEKEVAQAKEAGFREHLVKPLRAPQLKELLDRFAR